MIMIKKSLLSVLLAASPAMAGEFGLNRAEMPDLREIPVAEAPQPAPAEKFFEPTAICRDAFVNMINGAPEPAAPELRRVFKGISCVSAGKATLKGRLGEKGGNLRLEDPNRSLGLNRLTALPREFAFERQLRVHEAQDSFAKFHSDATAWESFALSLPKEMLAGGAPHGYADQPDFPFPPQDTWKMSGAFTAYFTVYTDNGGQMVPGEAVKMTCSAQ